MTLQRVSPKGDLPKAGLRGWLAFAACGTGFYFPKGTSGSVECGGGCSWQGCSRKVWNIAENWILYAVEPDGRYAHLTETYINVIIFCQGKVLDNTNIDNNARVFK